MVNFKDVQSLPSLMRLTRNRTKQVILLKPFLDCRSRDCHVPLYLLVQNVLFVVPIICIPRNQHCLRR